MQEIELKISPQDQPSPRRFNTRLLTIGGILVAAVLVGAAFLFFKDSFGPDGSLQVITSSSGAKVYLGERLVGETDYRGNHRPGIYPLRVEPSSGSAKPWRGQVRISPSALTVVERDLGPSEEFSSGITLALSQGSGVSVTSTPVGAKVFLDGTEVGQTPVARPSPSPGTHRLKVEYEGYLPREAEINITTGWKLDVLVELYKNPEFGPVFIEERPLKKSSLPDPEILTRSYLGFDQVLDPSLVPTTRSPWTKAEWYDLGTADSLLNDNPTVWAQGLYHHSAVHLKIDLPYHYLILPDGTIYEARSGGTDITSLDVRGGLKAAAEKPALRPGVVVVGYLGTSGGPTNTAKDSFAKLVSFLGKSAPVSVNKVKILTTPTGYLRVRSGPGTSYSEVARVNPGETYELLEEKTGWSKIKVSDTVSGWVSSQYVTKI